MICRLLRPFGLQRCYMEHVGIEGEQGVYRCWCGCEFLGLKEPIILAPGESVQLDIRL